MTEPDTVSWSQFDQYWRKNYRQGQHVTIIGPTGSGKTTLATELVKARTYVAALGVKKRDDTLSKLTKSGEWHRVEKWSRRPKTATRVVVWPKIDNLDDVIDQHRKTFGELLKSIYKIGYWTLWIDELTYLADHVGLRKMIKSLYILGRASYISIVGLAQRPAWIPLEAYSQATHLFLYRTGDERDLARIGGMNGVDSKQVARTVAKLPFHTFLYINLSTGEQLISTLENT